MSRFRHSITRRERRQMLWLFAAPLLIFAALFFRSQQNAAPLFPIPSNARVLESRWSPIAKIGGQSYVQRVQSPSSPAQFWAQMMPLLKAKNMNPDQFGVGPDMNRAGLRDAYQDSFRYFGLTQLPSPSRGCSFSYGQMKGAYYKAYMWPYKSGTIAEFWMYYD